MAAWAGLLEGSDGNLYGTLGGGGANGYGAVFKFVLPTGTGPVISVPPFSQTIAVGSNVTFAVEASGSPSLIYQWQKNGVNLTDLGNIMGSTNATLIITQGIIVGGILDNQSRATIRAKERR